MSPETIDVVVRVRSIAPSGLNPPQCDVINRLQTLAERGSIADLDVDVWGPSMGIAQNKRGPTTPRDRVVEFEQWATEHDYTLEPAFKWRSAECEDEGSGHREHRAVLTPLITLAIYDRDEQELAAVYPHIDGEEVNTVHDGVKAVESMSESEQSTDDEETETRLISSPL